MNHRISISEAEVFAGVGSSTLMRFADAGYFSLEKDEAGSPLFLKQELASLFNIDWEEPTEEIAKQDAEDFEMSAVSSDNLTEKLPAQDSVGRSSADYASAVTTEENVVAEDENTAELVSEPIPSLAPDEDFGSSGEAANEVDFEHDRKLKSLKAEVKKLRRVVELQEQLLDSREADIADLKKQRKWLQERIEKSEESAERDQLLLISEMQMLTKLVAEQTRKKSPVVAALEWLGMREPTPAHTGNTIDYRVLKERREEERKTKTQAA